MLNPFISFTARTFPETWANSNSDLVGVGLHHDIETTIHTFIHTFGQFSAT